MRRRLDLELVRRGLTESRARAQEAIEAGLVLVSGARADQPGRLVEWLYTRTPVYAWELPGTWYDIGTPEQLEAARADFAAQS